MNDQLFVNLQTLATDAADALGSLDLRSKVLFASLAVYVAYHFFLKPSVHKSKPSYHREHHVSRQHRKKHFPPPYPNGWIRVCSSADVDNGNVHSISALGLNLVAFRGKDNKIGVLHAYCPHLGAHLGQDSKVDSNGNLVCPFHHWKFDTSGVVKEIPYCRTKVPERAKTKSYHVREILGMVFLWHHSQDIAPTWEITYTKDVEDESKFYYGAMRQLTFDQHVLEMHMNSADNFHFQTVHRPIPLPVLEKVLFGLHKLHADYFEQAVNKGATGNHVCFFTEQMLKVFLFGKINIMPKWFLDSIVTKVTFEGPAIVHFSVKTVFGEMRMVKTLLPVEPFKVEVEARWFAEKSVPRFLVQIMASLAGRALAQDKTIWEHKTFHEKPMLVPGDGPFGRFGQYYRQFYDEKSISYDDIGYGGKGLIEW